MCIGTQRRPVASAIHRPIDTALLQTVTSKTNFPPTPQSYELPNVDSQAEEEARKAQANAHAHITVQHNYHDHANDNKTDYQEEHPARGGVTTPFPLKLHEMLDCVDRDGHGDIVSWQPHGRCFLVHKPKEFVEMLPHYFKLSKLASFQRQLNLYGFQRLTRGRDRGGYYHELFLRDRVFLAHNIQRLKVKGTGVRARSNPEQEPDFWAMPWVTSKPQHPALCAPQQMQPVPQMSSPYQNFPIYKQPEEDVVCAFGNKTFHYIDPFQKPAPQVPVSQPQPVQQGSNSFGLDALLNTEAESFFADFDFPEQIGEQIEDDDFFGNMLEQMIA